MPALLINRLAQALVALFGVITLVFFIQRLAGDPTLLLLPEGATQADIDTLRTALGYDRSLLVQYFAYLSDLLRFDFGRSVVQQAPVVDVILPRLPYTLALAGGALAVALLFGLPLGVAMGLERGRWPARIASGIALVGQSLPTFWSGILLMLLFGVVLGWLPPSGARGAESLIMPSVALGLMTMTSFARITRTAILDELGRDYVRTARAKGLGPGGIFWRHILRNGAIPLVTIGALEVANLLAGAVIVETVFAWPGLGLAAMQAISARDFMVVQAVVLLGALAAIALNLIADLLYGIIDPRIRMAREAERL
jgi:peptide/nickel transport system permease protein